MTNSYSSYSFVVKKTPLGKAMKIANYIYSWLCGRVDTVKQLINYCYSYL